eukprot:5516007-Pyramimonas_sp.AAC.1
MLAHHARTPRSYTTLVHHAAPRSYTTLVHHARTPRSYTLLVHHACTPYSCGAGTAVEAEGQGGRAHLSVELR